MLDMMSTPNPTQTIVLTGITVMSQNASGGPMMPRIPVSKVCTDMYSLTRSTGASLVTHRFYAILPPPIATPLKAMPIQRNASD